MALNTYVSVQEFKTAPTSIDLTQLDQTSIGNQNAQDASLLNILKSATGWVNQILCVDTLEASTFTETKEVHSSRDGRVTVHTRNFPIISMQTVQYKIFPSDPYSVVDMTNVVPYERWFTVYNMNIYFYGSFTNYPIYYTPYQLQRIQDYPMTINYTYTAGYMNTTLQSAASAGATTITVKDATGATAGSKFTIYDGANTEDCTVQSVNGNVITLSSPLVNNHAANIPVSAIPNQIKLATILLASYLIKERGSLGITMNETVASGTSMGYNKPSEIDAAKQLLVSFKRAVISA